MKQLRLAALLFGAVMGLFFTSCNNDSESTKEAATDTAAKETTTTAAAEPVNTIVTTPQGMVTITHKVADFAKWKAAYEAHDSARMANGIHNYVIGRSVKDSNIVFVALKVDDMAKAKAFSKDPAVKKVMQSAGVIGAPTFNYMTAVFQDTATLAAGTWRSRSLMNVKDWDTWEKAFKDGKQERLDNGLVDRVYGHDPDDTKKVFVVTAITDSSKALPYFKSDLLKKRREAGGVIGEPDRFIFSIVKRY